MTAMALQHRPLYGIGTVARLTGVKPDTLRIWERRYHLGASQKSPTGRRLFTQADLEHLQLVAALVESGTRIGEIATSERRTLEVLLRSGGQGRASQLPPRKPRIVFVGDALCDWLEEHQGCLANIDALLAPCPLAELDESLFDDVGEIDGLVVESADTGAAMLRRLGSLADHLGTTNVLALHRYSNRGVQQVLERQGYTVANFPPDAALLAAHLARIVVLRDAEQGSDNLGELVDAKPRLFDEKQLSAARQLAGGSACECPRHITDLVRALASFEEYSSSCSVENWQDASVHACVYTYAAQARWLMEKALGLLVDAHCEQSADQAL